MMRKYTAFEIISVVVETITAVAAVISCVVTIWTFQNVKDVNANVKDIMSVGESMRTSNGGNPGNNNPSNNALPAK